MTETEFLFVNKLMYGMKKERTYDLQRQLKLGDRMNGQHLLF